MRKINKIILHCSATKEGKNFTVEDITLWHKERGFKTIGYHFVIYLDGSVHVGRLIEDIGAHVSGHNSDSIGICYIGGLDSDGSPKDTRTPEQIIAMHAIIKGLQAFLPDITIHGHNEFANKACPCFNVKKEFEQ